MKSIEIRIKTIAKIIVNTDTYMRYKLLYGLGAHVLLICFWALKQTFNSFSIAYWNKLSRRLTKQVKIIL